jgi:hypothetical protein
MAEDLLVEVDRLKEGMQELGREFQRLNKKVIELQNWCRDLEYEIRRAK